LESRKVRKIKEVDCSFFQISEGDVGGKKRGEKWSEVPFFSSTVLQYIQVFGWKYS
jgi:hypothetical protein